MNYILDNAYLRLRTYLAQFLDGVDWIETPEAIEPRMPAPQKILWFLCALALAALAVKLHLAMTTFGSSDIVYWTRFKDYINTEGSFTIYDAIWYYNHPPMMSGFLKLITPLIPYSPNGFPYLMRLPAILSDVVIGFLLFFSIRRWWGETRAVCASVLFWTSPISIMVSGFHGNTDPVFMMLILLAAHQATIGRSAAQAGLLLGLGCNIKLVPIILVPLFFFWFREWRARIIFFSCFALMMLFGYGYHMYRAFDAISRNVFFYPSNFRHWGIAGFLYHIGSAELAEDVAKIIRTALLPILTAASWWLGQSANIPSVPYRERQRMLFRGIGWIFLIFMVITPGFGVQYLAWINCAIVFLGIPAQVGVGIFAGTFAFRVYDFWCGHQTWFFADSERYGSWNGPDLGWAYVAWLFLFSSLVILLTKRGKKAISLS